jgi:hypothetical protein
MPRKPTPAYTSTPIIVLADQTTADGASVIWLSHLVTSLRASASAVELQEGGRTSADDMVHWVWFFGVGGGSSRGKNESAQPSIP